MDARKVNVTRPSSARNRSLMDLHVHGMPAPHSHRLSGQGNWQSTYIESNWTDRATCHFIASSTRSRDRREPRALAPPTLKDRPAPSAPDNSMDPESSGPQVCSSWIANPRPSDASSKSQHSSSNSKVVEQDGTLHSSIDPAGGTWPQTTRKENVFHERE